MVLCLARNWQEPDSDYLTAAFAAYQRCFITLEIPHGGILASPPRPITGAPDEVTVVLPIRDILPFPFPPCSRKSSSGKDLPVAVYRTVCR